MNHQAYTGRGKDLPNNRMWQLPANQKPPVNTPASMCPWLMVSMGQA